MAVFCKNGLFTYCLLFFTWHLVLNLFKSKFQSHLGLEFFSLMSPMVLVNSAGLWTQVTGKHLVFWTTVSFLKKSFSDFSSIRCLTFLLISWLTLVFLSSKLKPLITWSSFRLCPRHSYVLNFSFLFRQAVPHTHPSPLMTSRPSALLEF